MAEEKLIEAVRAHKELYDTKCANYMNTKYKNRIWNEIRKDLNLQDGDEAKALWLKLRGSYRDARRRQARCMKSGAAPETIKPWRFQKQMSFLDQFMSTGLREGNVFDESDNDSELPPARPGDENFDRNDIEEESACQSDRRDVSVVEDNTNGRAEFTPTHSRESKKRKQDMQSLFKQSPEQREERAKQRAEERRQLESKDSFKDDPLYNFFIAMYQSTKKMPPSYQHKVRSQLFQAVSQAEEEILDISSRPLSTFSSSSNYQASYPSPQTSTDSQTLFHHSDQQENQQRCLEPSVSCLVEYVNQFDAK